MPKLAACPTGKTCPTLCYARATAITSKGSGTVYAKHYAKPSEDEYLRGAALESLHGPSLVNISMAHDGRNATIVLSGPATVWFAVGLNAQQMSDNPYALVVDGTTGKVVERKLAKHAAGAVLKPSVTVLSTTTADGVRTVTLSRAVAGLTKDHYTLPVTAGQINLITAVGNSPTFGYHHARTGAVLTLLPEKVDSCLCAPVTTEYLSYMNASTTAFNYDCVEEPRGDMAHGQRLKDGHLLADGKVRPLGTAGVSLSCVYR